VEDIRSEGFDHPLDGPYGDRIGERWMVPAMRILGEVREHAVDSVDGNPLQGLVRGQPGLPGGHDLDRVPARDQLPREDGGIASSPADEWWI